MFKKHIKFIIGGFVVLTLGIIALCFLSGESKSFKPKKHIAFVGKFTNAEHPNDPVSIPNKCAELVVKEYAQKFNKNYTDFDIEIKVFDNERSAERSREIYKEQIAPDTSIIGVVDFTWGSHLRACADVIKHYNIPVVTVNPDHNHLDYGHNALFLYNDDEIPEDLSSFITSALELKKVHFISEADYALHDVFHATFEKHSIAVEKEANFQGAEVSKTGNYNIITNQLDSIYGGKDSSKIVYTILNVHPHFGDSIIHYIEENFYNVKLICPAFATTLIGMEDFGESTGNELVIIDKPKDALSKALTKDLRKLNESHPQFFGEGRPSLYVKRAYDAMSVFNSLITNKPDSIPLSRNYLVKQIQGMPRNEIVTDDELYKFDHNNALIKELTFTQLRHGRLVSHPHQLNSNREVIPNLFFGMEIQDIFDLDVNSNSFSADFYYWVKVDTADHETERFISFQNMKQSESTRELVIEEVEDDILYRLYRVSGKFFVDYNLRDYPMDKQEIDIVVEILRPIDQVKISFDEASFVMDKSVLEKFKVPGWKKEGYFVTVNNIVTKSMRGDPKHDATENHKFKTFTFSLDVKRNWLSGFLEIILPLAMITFISIGLLYTKDLSFQTLGEVSVGTFLGIIAFSISLSETTPSTSYLTKADLLFWLSFITNFVSFMAIIVLNSMYNAFEIRQVNISRLKLVVTIAYPILVLAILFW